MNEEVGLYWCATWNMFFYRSKNAFGSRTGVTPRVPWHWAEYRAHDKTWCRSSLVPAFTIERSNPLQFLLITGEVFRQDRLEEGISAEYNGAPCSRVKYVWRR